MTASELKWAEVHPPKFAKWETPGDKVVGQVLHYSPHEGATTFNGEVCGYIDLETDDGVWRIVLDKDALKDRISAAYPQVGDWLAVKYLSSKDTGRGQPYKVFGVWRGEVV